MSSLWGFPSSSPIFTPPLRLTPAGVASGPMTAIFMLQFMIGASTVVGGNPLIDAFGVVAMVAMMPLISIQMVGFIYSRRTVPEIAREQYGDDEIIELWEVNAA